MAITDEAVVVVDPIPYVIALSKKHYEQIGFLPEPRLREYWCRGQLLLDFENNEPCGFLVWGNAYPVLRVYQVCIQYDAQRRLHASRLVQTLIGKAEREGYDSISCWVADDIPANDFWKAAGFVRHHQRIGGKARNRRHNLWIYKCTNPTQLRLIAATS